MKRLTLFFFASLILILSFCRAGNRMTIDKEILSQDHTVAMSSDEDLFQVSLGNNFSWMSVVLHVNRSFGKPFTKAMFQKSLMVSTKINAP